MNRLMIPILCMTCMMIGAMGASSWESESVRAELKAEKEAEIKELQEGYALALKPITNMCSNAAFRSIRASKEATNAIRDMHKLIEIYKTGNNGK